MTEAPILTELIQGGHAPTLIIAVIVIAALIFGVAAPLAHLGMRLGSKHWRAFRRDTRAIPITEGRRQQLQALATGRERRS